ncbi:hypothetical protein [Sphingomonas sp. Leaf343]|uniref:hypothetical protein n=1 Tax=Sphingomonas sp. Leaf343 TaxID=1736345 RepID=UPI00070089C6|nr:hypothetical protein [Sphingomonas sp. Leaf343]KQR83477.1 hypothetical protein ASG07_07050 [Sphingomonas sp. Leaf343]
MTNLRLVVPIATLMLGLAAGLFVVGFVRIPLALTILVGFALLWAVEVLRFRAATAQRENRS